MAAPAGSVAAHPSPKRKRVPPTAPDAELGLATSPKIVPELSGPDSPRDRVADQLRDLSILHPVSALCLGEASEDAVVRKKAKHGHTPMDIPETTPLGSGVRKKALIFGSSSAIPAVPEPLIETTADPHCDCLPAENVIRPPSPKGVTKRNRLRKRSPSPASLSSLTWQDSEITGHLVDPSTDPDDDGTGLNGIGFKPTPAIAFARSQRRKQQVQDWRAREAREARQKRSERRRREAAAMEVSAEEPLHANHRVVRFAA